MIVFARQAYLTEAVTWLWDCGVTFLVGLIVYKFRHKLNLTPLFFFVLMFSLGLHTAGVYGLYAQQFLGIDFDHYTHFFGSLAMCLILVNWLLHYKSLKYKFGVVCFIAILMTLGISAIHEIIEFLGYFFFGEGEGFLFAGAGDGLLTSADIGLSGTYHNAMIDLLFNAIGAVVGCILIGFKKLFS